jgi:hypothetical protein
VSEVPNECVQRMAAGKALLALSATMTELTPQLEEVAVTVNRAHPRLELLIGGQAEPSRISGGTLVRDSRSFPSS